MTGTVQALAAHSALDLFRLLLWALFLFLYQPEIKSETVSFLISKRATCLDANHGLVAGNGVQACDVRQNDTEFKAC